MDAVDRTLLHHLALDGRRSYSDLADIVGMSAPSTAERVRRLEDTGAITGYSAIVDPQRLGLDITAFVSVSLEHPRFREGFLESTATTSGVLECHHVAGEDDYLLKVLCAGTAGLESLVTEQIKGLDGVARTRTVVVLSTALARPYVPVR